MIEKIIEQIHNVRKLSPLVLNVTNYVAMNNSANALLAIGASPIMSKETDEMEDLAEICNSLVINIGTLEKNEVEAVIIAQKAFNKLSKPVILDPVGAGASSFRDNTIKKILLNGNIDYIRGNGSEIISIAGFNSISKGVDSINSSYDAITAAKELSLKYNCVVSISGQTDVIIDQQKCIVIENGSEMMTKVTALGCSATAILAAFATLNADRITNATSASALMSICGQIAAEKSPGPGTLQVNLLDTLYNIKEDQIRKIASVSVK